MAFIEQSPCVSWRWHGIGRRHVLIAADTRSHALHSSYQASTSAASCVGQVNRPNATHVDSNPTMSYMWDLSVALGIPWESSMLAAVSTPNKTHTAQLLASVDSS